MSDNNSYYEIERGSERGFGVVFAVVFLIVAVFSFVTGGKVFYWALPLSVAFALVAWVHPRLLKPLNFLWFKFGLLLGMIIAPLVMMIIYFLVVTPTGILVRAFRKDLLRLKKNPQQNSYWIIRHDDEPTSMKNQF